MCADIAIIDDFHDILESIKMVLERNGWDVQTYTAGSSFLADIDAGYQPNCIVLDPHLPGINGLEVAQAPQFKKCNVPIIGLTANIESSISKQLSATAARVILTKPVSADVLIGEIQAALVSSKIQRASLHEPPEQIH
jgi:FixJ family two-component response regulator